MVDAAIPALELRSVAARYGRLEVVHDVDLAVHRGEVVALLGPNGAGKSTVLRVAVGLHPPTRGSILLAGRRVNGVSPRRLAACGVCMVPEGRGVFANLTVSENLTVATYTGIDRRELQDKAFATFPRLAARRHQLAGSLSGGEQQMLALARALAVDPVVLILDELSMGLAPLVVEALFEVVADMAAQGVSVLAVEQFAHAVLPIADRAAVMIRGSIVATGDAQEFESELADHYLGQIDERAALPAV